MDRQSRVIDHLETAGVWPAGAGTASYGPAAAGDPPGWWPPPHDEVFASDGETVAPPEPEEPDRKLTDREHQAGGLQQSAEGAGQEAEAPPPPYATMPLGLDISLWQGIESGKQKVPQPQPLATFQRLAWAGKKFIFVKTSQDRADPTFHGHYENARAAGLIRGAFHWFTTAPVGDQVRLFLGLVPRVGPGELAPSLDVEDGSKALWRHYQYTYVEGKKTTGSVAGSTALLDAVQDWLDRVEAALGRTPLLYTGVIWRDHLKSTRMSQYPLWTLPSRWSAGGLGGWRHVELWQYAEDGKPFRGVSQYREPGVELPGADYDAYNGTIYGLRGLADLGRTGVGLTSLGAVVAHCEPDRHLHLVRESPPRTWTDTDLMRGALPGLGGDPVLCTDGTAVRLYFRSDGRVVEAMQADPAANWNVEDLSSIAGVTAVHDPRVLTAGDRRVVVFSGDDDDWHLLSRTASVPWTATHLLSSARRSGTTSVPMSSGQPAVYLPPGSADPRIVGRGGPLGHLVELALGNAGWAATDLTASSAGPRGIPPAATYSPAVYHRDAETFIVYRAIRGELWQIARGARQATNLTSAAPGSEIAVGHPTCLVHAGQVHVVYRGVDQMIHELTERSGTWSYARLPCDVPAASDPTCPDAMTAMVAFRAMDGAVRVLRLDGSTWTCTDTLQPATPAGVPLPPAPAPPVMPPPHGPSVFAALGSAADRFRELVAAGDEKSAVLLAYQHNYLDVNVLSDLVFFSRHRELGERRLRPDETALAQEWRTIREGVVGPAFAALTSGPAHGRQAAPAAQRSGEVPPEGIRLTPELEAAGGQWLRAITAAGAESGEAAGGLHAEGMGSIVGDVGKAASDVVTRAAGVLAQVAAQGFGDFIHRLDELERLAIADGYTLTQRVTAFRKLFYDSAESGKSYPGATGGGVWNILIPGAAATPLPPSWRTPPAAAQAETLRAQKEQIINGVHVDIGHVLTGLDARNHPTDINLSVLGFPLVRMRSNLEATTFTGDLGSVVGKYLYSSNRSFRDTAMELEPKLLDEKYNGSAEPDMSGNADAHLVPLDPSRTLGENLCAYHSAATGGWRRRWQCFVVTIGLGTFTPVPATMRGYLQSVVIGTFSGSTERWHADMQGEVMNAALAYAAATGHRADIVNVNADPGPGIVTPTFWEMYWNAAGWVLDEFLRRLKVAVRAELAAAFP
jgi:lysozyme